VDGGEDRKDGVAPSNISRRELLKKAAVAGVAIPGAGALAASAAARPQIRVRSRALPYEGVTLTFAKAPHGTDEKDLFEKWLAPFEKKTGAKVVHTIVPWQGEGAAYLANYSGPNPYDVSYQTSTDLTNLGSRGLLEDMKSWIARPDWKSERRHFPASFLRPSFYKGDLYGLPFIIGTIVVFYNRDLLAKAGIRKPPATTTQLIAAAKRLTDAPTVWGFNVPLTNKDFNWYFNLQNVHNFGGDIISKDFERATLTSPAVLRATKFASDLVNVHKVQPPVGTYDREAGVALFKGGRIAMLLDEPLRIGVFQDEGLPFKWDIMMPVGAPGGRRTEFSTTGHWVMAAKSQNKEAAWELIKFLSTAPFSKTYNTTYAFIPARDDVDVSKGNPLLAKNSKYALCCWDGLKTHPKISAILDAYGQGLEAAATGIAVAKAMGDAQKKADKILKT
jgi:ABC-type glycerol-3-phosphate transport system substrate-binding protein